MTGAHTQATYERILHRIDPTAKLQRIWALQGGISAQVTGLEFQQPNGQIRKVLVRQHGESDRALNPHIARDEFKLLQIVQGQGIPVPTPITFDESNSILPTPYIVLEYVDGDLNFTPNDISTTISTLARQLAAIHCIDLSTGDLAFLQPHRPMNVLRESHGNIPHEATIRQHLTSPQAQVQHNPTALLHGDFWTGNILWLNDELVAVIDWEDAALGDPLADLAKCRLEMLWAFGVEAMEQFTEVYFSYMPALDDSRLPYWDLHKAFRSPSVFMSYAAGWVAFGRPDVTAETMRAGQELFIIQALAKLSNI